MEQQVEKKKKSKVAITILMAILYVVLSPLIALKFLRKRHCLGWFFLLVLQAIISITIWEMAVHGLNPYSFAWFMPYWTFLLINIILYFLTIAIIIINIRRTALYNK